MEESAVRVGAAEVLRNGQTLDALCCWSRGSADRSDVDCGRKERGEDHCAKALAEHWKMERTIGRVGLEAWFWM